jgi:hypothetical protein
VDTNITGDLFKDYGKIMPPCIHAMYEAHIKNRTHFKNDERLKFFWWSFKASIPLDIVMDMWHAMVDNDATVNPREKETIKREGKLIYQKHQRSRETGTEFSYFGCVKMAQYCPFSSQNTPTASTSSSSSSSHDIGDIEDMGVVPRKIKCGNTLWDNKLFVPTQSLGMETRWPGRYLRKWSPMTATTLLAEYYLHKI